MRQLLGTRLQFAFQLLAVPARLGRGLLLVFELSIELITRLPERIDFFLRATED